MVGRFEELVGTLHVAPGAVAGVRCHADVIEARRKPGKRPVAVIA